MSKDTPAKSVMSSVAKKFGTGLRAHEFDKCSATATWLEFLKNNPNATTQEAFEELRPKFLATADAPEWSYVLLATDYWLVYPEMRLELIGMLTPQRAVQLIGKIQNPETMPNNEKEAVKALWKEDAMPRRIRELLDGNGLH